MHASNEPCRPEARKNNLWYHWNGSDTVFVFVHGIFSDSRSSWYHEDGKNPERSCFWPELVRTDKRFGDPSIYLAGYYTDFDSGPYEIRNCAEEIHSALTRPDRNCREPVMAKRRIIFICHSTGGIVGRYLIENYADDFARKRVGLVLIASPSYGAKWADRLALLSKLYKQRLGRQLCWGNWSLRDLDARFKNLVNERKRIPGLSGIEACENHFIVSGPFLPFIPARFRKFIPLMRNRSILVSEESAGRYFGAPTLLRATDHFSAVKPSDVGHPSHQLLVDFWHRFRVPQIGDILANAAEHIPDGATGSALRELARTDDEPPLAFQRITDFWDAEPNVLREGRLVTIEGTVSKFAPLFIGSQKRKRRLHLQFREWLESKGSLDSEKRAQLNAYLAYSAGQMVWRLAALDSEWRFLGLYQAIVRNSIPLFVHRDFFEQSVVRFLPANRSCVEARVTGRLRQIRGKIFEELVDLSRFDGAIRPAIDEAGGRQVFGMFIDGDRTGIEYLRDTPYLDGDIWVAVRHANEERFVTRFVNLADRAHVEREAQLLNEYIKAHFPEAEIIYEFDQVDRLTADYRSTDTDRILKQLTN